MVRNGAGDSTTGLTRDPVRSNSRKCEFFRKLFKLVPVLATALGVPFERLQLKEDCLSLDKLFPTIHVLK